MAIAYKSQGAGASTETSGAALSPLCPATVDAGDVLIAHVFWEGTATAPSTPSGWTLLSGPHVIQTTIARHWVFGKVADGTEDGAAVAFGNPAVTTQRAARVYSFSGRTAGTIVQLVTGFAATSHATDPQMPTVATTLNGAMAVALVAQNDNNAFASPTGESGGDWVEAVAEYTAALTPGLSLGIETCVPTADPGTVSGGSMATTNDPCGVIGFQVLPRGTTTAAVGMATETDTALAPSQTKVGATGLAEETDAAFALPLPPAIGRADESDAAVALASAKTAIAGTAFESDIALAPVGFKRAPMGIAPETDAAPSLSASKASPMGSALETDAALALAAVSVSVVGMAEETDAAFALYSDGPPSGPPCGSCTGVRVGLGL